MTSSPSGSSFGARRGGRGSRLGIALGAAFAVLGGLALFVVFGLPVYVGPAPETANPTAAPPPSLPAASAATAPAAASVPDAPLIPSAQAETERLRAEALSRFREGEQAEAAGDLARAREAYRAALALDAAFEPAREPLRRVEARLAAEEYRRAVSDVLARLSEGNIAAAEAALERARRINAGGAELDDLRQRVRAAAQAAALERLDREATALERQEKWADAVRLYHQALSVDRSAAFALRGRDRAQRHLDLNAAIDTYLAEPGRLHSAEPRAHARSLLATAVDEGRGLSDKRRRLEQLLAAAETPRAVHLRSDRQTEVTVLRVARLGAFDSHRLDLPPGRYVAVGSRIGYRDVRVAFEVSPASGDTPVVVQCSEPIR